MDWVVEHFEEIDSTNRWLLEQATQNCAAVGTVAVADFQSQGKGRLGRSWIAEPRSALLMSMLLPVETSRRATLLALRVGYAATQAVQNLGATDVWLKWPNDLVSGSQKLAGILAERVVAPNADPDKLNSAPVVVGMGLNILATAYSADTAGISLQELGVSIDRDTLLAKVLENVAAVLGVDDETFVKQMCARLATLGQEVRVDFVDGSLVTGTASGVTVDGALTVTSDDGISRDVHSGDVHHLLRPGGA